MKNNKLLIFVTLSIFLMIIGITAFLYAGGGEENDKKQLILIVMDGVQYNRLKEIYDADRLPNIKELVSINGFFGNATITGHNKTETAPGNAELHTGLSESITGISDNGCGKTIPEGKTTFERLADQNIRLGLVYGKTTCYIPDSILKNAKPKIGFWHNRTTYIQDTYVGSNCADSRDVSTKAGEFISANKDRSFYLVVYYGGPDCAGHAFGENSKDYEDSIINADDAIGILLEGIKNNNLEVNMIISADHGWNEGAKGHGNPNGDTKTIPFLSNNLSMVGKIPLDGIRKQCNIAPTILDYFGVDHNQYDDFAIGCESLLNN